MYTYVQRPGCKKVNTAMHVHTGGVSNAYSRIRMTRARVHGCVGTEKLCWRRVHVEATECVMFIGRQQNASCSSGGNRTRGSQPAWTEHAMETRPGIPQNGGNGLVFDRPRSKRDLVHREGSGVPQNGGNGPPMVETGVLLIGRGVAYRKMEETDLRAKIGVGSDLSAGASFFREIQRPFWWVPDVRWRNHYFERNKEAFSCVRPWTQLSASPRTVYFRWCRSLTTLTMPRRAHPRWWTTARPRTATSQRCEDAGVELQTERCTRVNWF